ncbi:MAG TPA: hypothetical protein H9693_07010 [Firmicutes bacterium]|nr:hypothetical protein [Bacillota bacterium]
MTDEEKYTELSRGKRLASNLIGACGLLACGGVLLAFGIAGESIGVSVIDLIAPVALLSVGLVLLATALIQRNTVSMYLSFLFLVPALVSFLANLTEMTYSMLYPLYIATPAIASLFTMFMSGEYKFHIRIILVFAVPAVFFALFAAEIWTVGVLVPAIIMYAGLLALYSALSASAASEE